MAKGTKLVMIGLFSLVFAASVFMTGCSRYANEQQLTTLDESEAAATSAEDKVAKLEKEKAELQAKLDEKKKELEKVQAEHKKVEAKLAQ
jgi:peptidoglycan hydrolase CwlO-like protein